MRCGQLYAVHLYKIIQAVTDADALPDPEGDVYGQCEHHSETAAPVSLSRRPSLYGSARLQEYSQPHYRAVGHAEGVQAELRRRTNQGMQTNLALRDEGNADSLPRCGETTAL